MNYYQDNEKFKSLRLPYVISVLPFGGRLNGIGCSPDGGRLCRNVIAREGNDRSNLISSRIHKITTTPARRLVTCDLKGYDKEELRQSLRG